MVRFDMIVRGGSLATFTGNAICDIAVADGWIVEIDPDIEGDAAREIDATGLIVMAGGVDPHVHFNEPGRTDWEGWEAGSRALVAGGVTTCIEMPLNAHPPTLDRASFEAKAKAASRSSRADFALWGGLTPDNLDHLDYLAMAGAIGFKAFMSRSGTDDFRHAGDDTLYQGMQIAARHGLPVAVHAENDAITHDLARRSQAAGRTGMQDYLSSRPVLAEVEAIGRVIAIAEATGCALHVVHVSSGRGVALVAEARERGVDVTCETCPHYLAFTDEDAVRIGALAKCAPPLRFAAVRDSLWEMVLAGEVDMLASDHSPAPPSMKTGDDAFAIWGGISGCQHFMAASLTLMRDRDVQPHDLADLLGANAARRFQLPGKGELAVGADADLSLWATQAPTSVGDVRYRHPVSAWNGFAVAFVPRWTFLRGEVAWRDGAFGEARGRLIPGPAAV